MFWSVEPFVCLLNHFSDWYEASFAFVSLFPFDGVLPKGLL